MTSKNMYIHTPTSRYKLPAVSPILCIIIIIKQSNAKIRAWGEKMREETWFGVRLSNS